MSSASNEKVSADEVRHIATLSNLRLTLAEETSMQRDLNAILLYISELNELDTVDVPAMAQVGEMLLADQPRSDSRSSLRPDAEASSLPRDAVMQGAPETDGVFFKVPKVIER